MRDNCDNTMCVSFSMSLFWYCNVADYIRNIFQDEIKSMHMVDMKDIDMSKRNENVALHCCAIVPSLCKPVYSCFIHFCD